MRIKATYKPSSEPIVSIYDPAIDHDQSNMAAYEKTRNIEHLVFKMGHEPTKFYFRNLPSNIFVNIQTKVSAESRGIVAFGYALERIEGLKEFCLNEGVELTHDGLNIWEPDDVIEIDGKKVKGSLSPEPLFHLKVIMELGFLVCEKALLMRGQEPDFHALRF